VNDFTILYSKALKGKKKAGKDFAIYIFTVSMSKWPDTLNF